MEASRKDFKGKPNRSGGAASLQIAPDKTMLGAGRRKPKGGRDAKNE